MNDVSSDGDGILDAEELDPMLTDVSDLKTRCPAKYTIYTGGTKDRVATYSDVWSPREYHDIANRGDDKYSTVNSYFEYEEYIEGVDITKHYFLALNPFDPDTDGDGVPDGVEVTDDNYELGRVDSNGNKLGYWPSEKKYTEGQSTNPLDPRDN